MKKASNENVASLCSERAHYIEVEDQCSRLLGALRKRGRKGINTVECRDQLQIMHPAGRVKELQELGYAIVRLWTRNPKNKTSSSQIARYVLEESCPRGGVQRDIFESQCQWPRADHPRPIPLMKQSSMACSGERFKVAAASECGGAH